MPFYKAFIVFDLQLHASSEEEARAQAEMLMLRSGVAEYGVTIRIVEDHSEE